MSTLRAGCWHCHWIHEASFESISWCWSLGSYLIFKMISKGARQPLLVLLKPDAPTFGLCKSFAYPLATSVIMTPPRLGCAMP